MGAAATRRIGLSGVFGCAAMRYSRVIPTCRCSGVGPASAIVAYGRCAACAATVIGSTMKSAGVASATAVAEPMAAPSVVIAPSGPRPHAEEDAVIEIAGAVETNRGARVGCVVVVAVGANRRRSTDVDGDLRVGLGRQSGEGQQCRGADERLPSTLKELDPGRADGGHLFGMQGDAG